MFSLKWTNTLTCYWGGGGCLDGQALNNQASNLVFVLDLKNLQLLVSLFNYTRCQDLGGPIFHCY